MSHAICSVIAEKTTGSARMSHAINFVQSMQRRQQEVPGCRMLFVQSMQRRQQEVPGCRMLFVQSLQRRQQEVPGCRMHEICRT